MPAAGISTVDFRALNALALALLDEPPFHSRDHAEYRQDDVAYCGLLWLISPRVEIGGKHDDKGPALLGLVNEVEDVTGVAPKAVEARDHGFVTESKELQYGRQLGPAIAVVTRDLLRTDYAAAFSLQPGDLPIKALIECAEVGVTDAGYGL
ncbi:hypothetical protein ACYQR9_01730 [Methylobacterium sp. CM6241]